jgi:hypothetical protein
LETKEKETEAAEQILAEKTATATPEAFFEALNYILRHASGKKLTEKEKREAQFYAQRRLLVLSPRQQGDSCLPGDEQKLRIPDTRGRALGAIKR